MGSPGWPSYGLGKDDRESYTGLSRLWGPASSTSGSSPGLDRERPSPPGAARSFPWHISPVARISIEPYSDAWAHDFARLARRLRSVLGERALRIDHIGSTAVPGLAAKDRIDVQVTVAQLDDANPLGGAGFEEPSGSPTIGRQASPTGPRRTGASGSSMRRPASGVRTSTSASRAVRTSATHCCFATTSASIRRPPRRMPS